MRFILGAHTVARWALLDRSMMIAICDHITNVQLEVPFWYLKLEVTICDFKFETSVNWSPQRNLKLSAGANLAKRHGFILLRAQRLRPFIEDIQVFVIYK